jgi:hypothetical protein
MTLYERLHRAPEAEGPCADCRFPASCHSDQGCADRGHQGQYHVGHPFRPAPEWLRRASQQPYGLAKELVP